MKILEEFKRREDESTLVMVRPLHSLQQYGCIILIIFATKKYPCNQSTIGQSIYLRHVITEEIMAQDDIPLSRDEYHEYLITQK